MTDKKKSYYEPTDSFKLFKAFESAILIALSTIMTVTAKTDLVALLIVVMFFFIYLQSLYQNKNGFDKNSIHYYLAWFFGLSAFGIYAYTTVVVLLA